MGFNRIQNESARILTKRLATERRTAGLSIYQLADLSGYSVDHLMKMECGARMPSFQTLTGWAESLGYDLALVKKA